MKPEQKHKGHPHAELMKLYAEDAMESETPWRDWECRSKCGTWNNLLNHPSWVKDIVYRRKPRFIEINGHQVPEPVKDKELLWDKYYYVPSLFEPEKFRRLHFRGDSADNLALENGCIHLTEEAAIIHAKALLSFTKKEAAQ